MMNGDAGAGYSFPVFLDDQRLPIERVTLPNTDAEHVAFYRRSKGAYRNELTRIGFIYALHVPELKAVKIGRTIDPLARIKGYQTAYPRPLRYALLLPTLTPYADERELHQRFHDHLIQGEWYREAPEVIEWMKAAHPHAVPDRPLSLVNVGAP